MVDELSNDELTPLPTQGPWMPPPGNRPPWEAVDRNLGHRLAKLASGLPGEFEYPLTKCRLNLFLDQIPGNDGYSPQSPTFEFIDRFEDLLTCLHLRTETSDPSDLRLLTLRIDLRLFANAWELRDSRQIADPIDVSDASFRGVHTIDAMRIDDSGLTFRHNWDGWSHDWVLSFTYLSEHFVGAIAYGAARDHCDTPFASPSIECDRTFTPLLARPGLRSPDVGAERVSAMRSHSRFAHSEVWQHYIYLEQLPELFGWAFVDLHSSTTRVPEVYELFIHPIFRRMRLVRALMAMLCFDLYGNGYREIVLTCREADLVAWEMGINSWPSWLADLLWTPANTVRNARSARVQILDLLPRIASEDQLAIAKSRGSLNQTDFLLDPSTHAVEQFGIVL